MRAQDIKAPLKEPQRQTLPWKDDEDTPVASGDLLTAAATAPMPKPAVAAAAMAASSTAAAAAPPNFAATVVVAATETEPVEAAEVVQARLLP